MSPMYLFAALLLLAGCKSPAERAQLAALRMLRHELTPPSRLAEPGSLRVYPFTTAQIHFFTSDVPTFSDGYLVTYSYTTGSPTSPRRTAAVFVADNDSAFFFSPLQHAAEFRQRYGVVPAVLPVP